MTSDIPGLREAMDAVWAFLQQEDEETTLPDTRTAAALLAAEALRAATPHVLAAAFADVADDFSLMAPAGAEWAAPAGEFLDQMSAHILDVTRGSRT